MLAKTMTHYLPKVTKRIFWFPQWS